MGFTILGLGFSDWCWGSRGSVIGVRVGAGRRPEQQQREQTSF